MRGKPQAGDLASFDSAALAFARAVLARGGTLSRSLLARSDLGRGRAVALVIEGTPLAEPPWRFGAWAQGAAVPTEGVAAPRHGGRVRWFRVAEPRPGGWVFLAGARSPEDDMAEMVIAFLRANPRRLLLLEEAFNTSGESAAGEVEDVARFGGEVYHLAHSRSDAKEVERAWEASIGFGSWERVGVLTSLPDIAAIAADDELSEELIRLLAERAEGLLIGAFDGEGVLLWVFDDADGRPHPWAGLEEADG
jgi:hypothetical protein